MHPTTTTDSEPAPSRHSFLTSEVSPRTLIAVLGVATLARLVAVFGIRWQPAFDDAWYLRTARDLAEGRGYLDDAHNVTAYFPVGYPATLAALSEVTGLSLRAAQLLNIAFACGTMLCIYRIVRTLGSGSKVAVTAMALFGFLPNQIISCCVTMSEIAFTFAVTLGVALALQPIALRRPWWWAVVGAVFGWATLIRSQTVLLPLITVIIVTYVKLGGPRFAKQAAVGVALVSLGMAAVVGPWTYRNYRVFDAFVLVSTNGGDNLYIGNNPATIGRYQEPAKIYPQGVEALKIPELERDYLGRKLGWAYIKAHPWQTLLRAPRKLWYMYRSDLGVTNWVWEYNRSDPSLLYYLCQGVTQLGYLLVLGAGSLWLALGLRRPPPDVGTKLIHAITLASVVYFSAITMLFFGDARFHQPLMPGFAICAAYVLATLRFPARQPVDEAAHAR